MRVITVDGTATDYAYDYEGNRVKKTVTPLGGSATSTLYIGDVYEKTGSTGTTHIFAGGQRIGDRTGGAVTYSHGDHLGSTSLMTNGAGSVVQTTRYTPYGTVYESSGSVTDVGFTGHRMDGDGLIYMKARYYDPGLGRFLTPDSIVQDLYNPQTLNRFTYVENNPVNNTDPTGHWSFKLKNFLAFAAMPSLGPAAFNIHHFHAPTMWNRNRDSVVNAGIAYVSGGGPIGAAAAFAATQFVQSHGGQTTVRNTATILYKNNIMGEREARIFSEVLWYTIASMSMEKALATSGPGGFRSERDFEVGNSADESLVSQTGGEYLGRSAQQIHGELINGSSDVSIKVWENTSGGKALVASGDAFGQSWLPLGHTSVSIPGVQSSKAPWYEFFTKGTCHQYSNSNFISGGFGASTTRGFFGFATSAIHGYYGGQLWSKISYSGWESEKR